MKKSNKIRYIAITMVFAIIVGISTPAFAVSDSTKQLTAYYTSGGKNISVYVNGTKVEKDNNGKAVTPFTVDGTTYLPVRAISDALGKSITWEGSTASVKIDDIKLNMPGSINDTNAKVIVDIVDTDYGTIENREILDYTFTLDEDAVGEWKTLGWYENVSDFNPAQSYNDYLALIGLSIYADGTMTERAIFRDGSKDDKTGVKWTKGYFTDSMSGAKLIPAYAITAVDGKMYMVMEWKTMDYFTDDGYISYYVFEKVTDSTSTVTPVTTTATVKQLTAAFTSGGNPISIYVNGTKIIPKDGTGKEVSPFIVDGTTYLPVRAVAAAFEKDVTWEGSTASVKITDKADTSSSDAQNDNNAKLTTTVDADGNRHDKLDYTFTPDKDAVGEWKNLGWYENPKKFYPDEPSTQNQWFDGISIYPDGTMTTHLIQGDDKHKNDVTGLHWTYGYFVDLMTASGLDVVPAYFNEEINGKMYLFLEWKSMDYVKTGEITYYVFERTSDTPAANTTK